MKMGKGVDLVGGFDMTFMTTTPDSFTVFCFKDVPAFVGH